MTSYSTSSAEQSLLRLLLVEDDEVDRTAVRRALRRQGITQNILIDIIETTDLQSARAVISSQELDCALVDYRLPDGTALTLVQELAQLAPRRLPLVILTGLEDQEVAIQALRHGAQDYISKSEMNAQVLWRAIRYAIERVKVTDLQQRLLHADRLVSIGQLAAGVAHEINNPASYVLGNLELIEEYLDAPRAAIADIRQLVASSAQPGLFEAVAAILTRHGVDRALAESRNMISAGLFGLEQIRSIIQNLRSFSRLERDQIEMVALGDTVRAACNIVHNEIRHRATLRLDLEPVPPIAADRGKLTQVFTNLLMNAAQAIPPGAAGDNYIQVNMWADDRTIRVAIRDSGSGMPPDVVARIFEPFFTTKSRESGTGLGMSLCLGIVRQHGGNIEVQSWQGSGTEVTVILHEDTGLLVSASQASPAEQAAPATRARILVVDDEIELLNMYRRMLAPHHEVVVAESGKRGIEILTADDHFDVILCDIMMPEIDGIGLYEFVRKQRAHLCPRVLFCSGGTFIERARSFLAEQTPPCLQKPLSKRALLEAVQRLVGQS
jgi:two-component system cell cycle sensor histidine kinase/response regulator CckA